MSHIKYLKILFCSTVACVILAANAYGQDVPKELYTASGIPDSLKEDANSIVRYSRDEIVIKSPGKLSVKHHRVVTILNEKGDNEAIIEVIYNRKFDTYSYVDTHVYDAAGKMLKKYHKTDMYDGLASNDETLVTEDRFLGLKISIPTYPETIDVEYEENISSFIDLPVWGVQGDQQSIQNETYIISVKPEMGFRYLCNNISLKPDKSSDSGSDTYTWKVSGKKAYKYEDGAMPWRLIPNVEFTINKFDFYGYPGDISTWKSYGQWVYDLNKDVCTLNPQRAAEIRKMTDTIKTDKLKAKFLYEYMQKNMRYVSVQLGIGGYKPFDANFVDQKKYGDCKALSNYMYALLKAVNIPSYWAIIRRGANELPANPNFPFNTFNHEILCLPFKNDTTWLECTGNTQPFGVLDITTKNHNALLITEDGGKLVNTPKSTANENQINSEAYIKLDADGGAKAQIKIQSTGEYRTMYLDLAYSKLDEQKEFLLRYLNIKQPSAFDFKSGQDAGGVKELNLDLDYDRFCDVIAGDKRFYKPLVFNLWSFTLPITEKRRTDYYFEHPMQKSCITTIDLPAGFEVETMPSNVSLKFSYGNYEINYAYDAAKNQVVSRAKFILTNQVIPAAKYTEMQQYMDGIAKAQNKKLVIKKKA